MCHQNRYFSTFVCCWLYCYGLSKQICVCEGQLLKILGLIFRSDQEKNHVEFFDARCNT